MTARNIRQVKAEIAELEQWLYSATAPDAAAWEKYERLEDCKAELAQLERNDNDRAV